ncbi:MAG TPA: zinc ABC transporter substrate-binding protein [Candidatus Dormibacteraeota bacterium]|nr:zinc ABC transporter substrate-binding protein [Candidatus Dormibacteraeota bacterium]
MARRLGALIVAAALVAACGTSLPAASTGGRVRVVAAENFWGSIASQVGGEHATVTSIVANPNADPHDYEPTPGDARAVATAQYVIANGVGYDAWMQKLIDANPVSGRVVITVGDLVGKRAGDNPHLWYSPDYVTRFVDRVASDLGGLDPADAAYFKQAADGYRSAALAGYFAAITAIKTRYAGTKVGASESVFSYMAGALGLDLITPAGYMNAISEGQEPSAADRATAQGQIASRAIAVFIINSQNSTPDVRALADRAKAAGIPVTTVTETLAPATATFQDWQAAQLKALLAALGG